MRDIGFINITKDKESIYYTARGSDRFDKGGIGNEKNFVENLTYNINKIKFVGNVIIESDPDKPNAQGSEKISLENLEKARKNLEENIKKYDFKIKNS